LNIKIFKIFGFLAPTIGYSFIALAIASAPNFSWTKNALSDLGVMKNSALFFNHGLMLSAIFMLIFGIGLMKNFKNFIGIFGSFFYSLSAIALFFIGLFPENFGLIHLYFSIAFFAFIPLALIFFGIYFIKNSKKAFGLITLALGSFSILVWLIPWNSIANITNLAIPEALSSMPGALWTFYTAYRLIE